MEALLPLIVQIVAGVIGGEAVGAALKQAGLSHVVKVISGAIGGVAGGMLLDGMAGGGGAMGGMLGDAIGGVAGGGILTAIAGMVMGQMAKR